jgi:hypothetical protein
MTSSAGRLAVGVEQAHEARLGLGSRGILEIEQRPAILRCRLWLGEFGIRQLD